MGGAQAQIEIESDSILVHQSLAPPILVQEPVKHVNHVNVKISKSENVPEIGSEMSFRHFNTTKPNYF